MRPTIKWVSANNVYGLQLLIIPSSAGKCAVVGVSV